MKKIFGVLFAAGLVLALSVSASADVYHISLATSGTTTAPSGVSPMIVKELSGATFIPRLEEFEIATAVIQLASVDTGLTVAEVERNKGGDNSGVSGTLRYREALEVGMLPYSQPIDIWSGMLMSGNTPWQVEFDLVAMGSVAFEWVSGVTPMGAVDFIVKILDK